MSNEVLANDAKTVVVSGGTSALYPEAVETWQVANPENFPIAQSSRWTGGGGGNEFHVAELDPTTGSIVGGEICVVNDSWATTLTSSLASGATTASVAPLVNALPCQSLISFSDGSNLAYGNLTSPAPVGATTLDFANNTPASFVSMGPPAFFPASATSVTIDLPGSYSVGDELLFVIITGGNTANWAYPGGFTNAQVGGALGSSPAYDITTFLHIAGNVEPSSYTFYVNGGSVASPGGVAFCIDYQGYDSVSGNWALQENASTTTATFPTVSCANNETAIGVVLSTTGKTYSTPSGATGRGTGTGSGLGATVVDEIMTGSTTPSWTCTTGSSDTNICIVFTLFNNQGLTFEVGTSISSGAEVQNSNGGMGNAYWSVTRGWESLVVASTGNQVNGVADTCAHSANWIATQVLSGDALGNYVAGYVGDQLIEPQMYQPSVGPDPNATITTYGYLTFWDSTDTYSFVVGCTAASGENLQILGSHGASGILFANNADALGLGASPPSVNGTIASAPPPSSTVHSALTGPSSFSATAWQNTLSYDVLVTLTMKVTAATNATVVVGIGGSSPSTNTVVGSFSTTGTVGIGTFKVPAGYYMVVNTTGTLTATLQSFVQAA